MTRASGTYFTSDHHFGHANVIRYSQRPFKTVEEMDAALIARWNAAVDHSDTVYHLGDFTLNGRTHAEQIFTQLNGHIAILASDWHHDKRWLPPGLGTNHGIVSASGVKIEILRPIVSRKFIVDPISQEVGYFMLSHLPLASWDRRHYGGYHLHGHSHGHHRADGRILDVGVDCHKFAPISLAAVVARLRREPFEQTPRELKED